MRSVHEPDDLLPAAYELARKFTDNRSPVATAIARQMMYRNSAQPHPIEAHRVDSLGVYYQSLEDGKEGIAAFLEKRDPDFPGKASEMPPSSSDRDAKGAGATRRWGVFGGPDRGLSSRGVATASQRSVRGQSSDCTPASSWRAITMRWTWLVPS